MNLTTQQKNGIPRHVAIIMDGNGRWAKERGLDRSEGHVKGVATVREITEKAGELGIDYLTLYTFSTENWNRPQEEVEMLMKLIVKAIRKETPDLIKNNVRLLAIGDIQRLPAESRDSLLDSIERTSACTGLTLVLALSYSSRWEITDACRQLALRVKKGEISPDQIDESLFSSTLDSASIPDPDLLIRTGGDRRISNFLLWQLAYSELYFTNTYWPDFSPKHFEEAIKEFQTRERRFGLTSEQITQ